MCADNVDQCITPFKEHSVTRSFFQGKEFAGFLNVFKVHPFPASAAASLTALEDLDFSTPEPVFALAHVASPHAPYSLDSDCSFVSSRSGGSYTDQTSCVNQLVLNAVRSLPADTVVLITSDHGGDYRLDHSLPPTDWPDEIVNQRMTIFAATRLPATCPVVPDTITLMNLVRATVSCALGTDADFTPDRSFVVPLEYPDSEYDLRPIDF